MFLNSLEKNQFIHEMLVDVFQSDSKVQQDMSRGEAIMSADEFADEAILFAEETLVYPLYMLEIAVFFSFISLLVLLINPSVAAGFLTVAGIFSFFTLVPPFLLFRAATNLTRSPSMLNIVPK